ncbi:calcium-binding protein [Lysobacteraceae bacterium NML75-0749]|nr:calcium-binding protein [Xanthomonadaceae bacterium NML75-0749]PJK02896.1 calcium-binding protein [Xanthomonadaceae bacterium NML91-0268]
MISRKTLAAMTVALVVAPSSQVLAQAPHQHNNEARMSRHVVLDADKDGLISRAEAATRPRLAQRFDSLDSNKDGSLSQQELSNARSLHSQRGRGIHRNGLSQTRGMRALDKDADGRISRAEAEARPAFFSRFARMDLNRDGFIDRADQELRRQQRRDAMFAAADSDKDGKLSRAEFDNLRAARGHRAHGEQTGAAQGQSRR